MPKSTFAGLLRIALKDDRPVDPNAVLFEHGDARWFERSGRDESEKAVPERVVAADREPVTVRLAPMTGRRRRGWERARPSGLEGGSCVHLNHVFAADRSAAFLRGQLIHAWFEQIEWLDDGRPDESTMRRVADEVLAKQGAALNPRGTQYTSENIKDHLQRRDMREELRASGMVSGGPDSYSKKDLQDFANALDRYVTARRREVNADH